MILQFEQRDLDDLERGGGRIVVSLKATLTSKESDRLFCIAKGNIVVERMKEIVERLAEYTVKGIR